MFWLRKRRAGGIFNPIADAAVRLAVVRSLLLLPLCVGDFVFGPGFAI